MRCPDCNKFVSFDAETEPELDLSVDSDGNVSGTCRIVNTCTECGQELKEATLDVEIDLTQEVSEHRDACRAEHEAAQAEARAQYDKEQAALRAAYEREHPDATEPYEPDPFDSSEYDVSAHESLDVASSDGSRTERMQTHDRHGKPIKNYRYMRHYYGAEVNVTVQCACGEEFSGSTTVETTGSGMDELV